MKNLQLNRKNDRRITFLFVIVAIIIINVLAVGGFYFRWDWTHNNRLSLSKVSKVAVKQIHEPLTIKVFLSKDLPPQYQVTSQYIHDLLTEYDSAASSKFKVEYVDVASEDGKKEATEFGISPVNIQEYKSDQISAKTSYLGLVILHGDLIERIDQILAVDDLEYRITTKVRKMSAKIDFLGNMQGSIKITLFAGKNSEFKELDDKAIKQIDDYIGKVVAENNQRLYNKLEYAFVDTDKSSDNNKLAEKYGLNNGKGVLGLVIDRGDQFVMVPIELGRDMFGRLGIATNFDKSINQAVDSLLGINRKVGYLTGHQEKSADGSQQGEEGWRSALGESYDLSEINLAEQDIPADIKTIIVNGPAVPFSDYELYKIDQFLMKGNSVIFLLDSFKEFQPPQGMNMGMQGPMYLPNNPNLQDFLAFYGLSVNSDVVLDKKCAKTFQRGMGEINLYYYPLLGRGQLSDKNVSTKYLSQIMMQKNASLSINDEVLKNSGLKSEVLANSSNESWLMQGRVDLNPYTMNPPADEKSLKSYPLAVAVEGKFNSYFAGKPVPENNPAVDKKESKTEKKDETRIITPTVVKSMQSGRIVLVGSSDIPLSRQLDDSNHINNISFINNLVDFASDDMQTPEMRNKGSIFQPLSPTSSAKRSIVKIVNMLVLPLLAIGAGILVWQLGKRRRNRIMKEYSQENANE